MSEVGSDSSLVVAAVAALLERTGGLYLLMLFNIF